MNANELREVLQKILGNSEFVYLTRPYMELACVDIYDTKNCHICNVTVFDTNSKLRVGTYPSRADFIDLSDPGALKWLSNFIRSHAALVQFADPHDTKS